MSRRAADLYFNGLGLDDPLFSFDVPVRELAGRQSCVRHVDRQHDLTVTRNALDVRFEVRVPKRRVAETVSSSVIRETRSSTRSSSGRSGLRNGKSGPVADSWAIAESVRVAKTKAIAALYIADVTNFGENDFSGRGARGGRTDGSRQSGGVPKRVHASPRRTFEAAIPLQTTY